MAIYRIENEKGWGCYHSSVDLITRKGKTTPLPHYDLVGWYNLPNRSKYVFGFPTMKTILNWFTKGQLKSLKKAGYKIYKYDKKPRYKSKYQCVFLKGKSKRIEVKLEKLLKKGK